jgi:hypothetical protein
VPTRVISIAALCPHLVECELSGKMRAEEAPLFVPVVTEPRLAEAATRNSTTITIEIGGTVVRVAAGVDPVWLRDVLRAVRAAI